MALGSLLVGIAPANASSIGSTGTATATVAAVQQALDALPPIPNTSWGPAAGGTQELLTISAATPAAGARQLLDVAGRFGGLVQVQHTSGPFTQQIYDGDGIDNGTIICSVGFNVVKGGVDYLITAGHCTQGLPYWQGVGPTVATNFPGTDFGLVRNDTWDGPGDVNHFDGSVTPITAAGDATVGEYVCASGKATGVTCGSVTAVNQTVTFNDGTVVRGLIQTNVHTDHGDSGGPLFDGTIGLGTVSGGDTVTDFFQPLPQELSAYGVTLAPSGGGGIL